MAEREGFEPPIRLPVCRISSAVHSTTLPPLHSGAREVSPRAGKYLAKPAERNKIEARADNQPHSFLESLPPPLPLCLLVNRALPSPVPMVSTPQRLTSCMNGTSLKPCTTASLCIRIVRS